ncbi:MAG: response regulator [Alphaproteobacteria bacterium]|nr:response regulator [Alphaproteobacteria bacterium]
MRILVVDDDVDFADGMAEMLALFGHDTHTAYSCDAGIAAAKDNFDLALIDVGLADRSGTECARTLRKFSETTACVLMTGHSADALAQKGISVDEFDILRKPVKLEDLTPYLKD